MDVLTGWVKPPRASRGLDHIGAQAPCIKLYGQLVPGITNVTDRARYYTLYPWFIWATAREGRVTTKEEFTRLFRRADCLFTLIAERHARELGRSDPEDSKSRHSGGMVGINTLGKVLDRMESGEAVDLRRYTTTEDGDPNRYFKNKLGGLGQYYRGTLLDLGLLQLNEENSLACTRERGVPAAKAVEAGVDSVRFLEALQRDTLTVADLDALAGFCPCQLGAGSDEHQYLAGLLFDVDETFGQEGRVRRETLVLLLQLAADLEATDEAQALDRPTALGCLYAGRLPGGQEWEIPESLHKMREGWRLYVRNELLSIAAQGWFAVALDVLSVAGRGQIRTGEELAETVIDQAAVTEALDGFSAKTFEELVAQEKLRLARIEDWTDEGHEYQLARSIPDLWHWEDGDRRWAKVSSLVLRVLAALAARGQAVNGTGSAGAFDTSEDDRHEINLSSFRFHSTETWKKLSIPDLGRWLTVHWGVEVHLRVALHKLRYERLDTFRVRPTEYGLDWVETPAPVFTNPRLRQAMQMLVDIGALVEAGEDGRRITDLGREHLEAFCGT